MQQIPIASLFPGRHSMDPTFLKMTADGRHLVTALTGDDGFAKQAGGVIFEVKER